MALGITASALAEFAQIQSDAMERTKAPSVAGKIAQVYAAADAYLKAKLYRKGASGRPSHVKSLRFHYVDSILE